MLLAVIIIAVAGVTATFIGAVAYGVPKLYWYWTQSRLLGIQQADSTRLVNLHVEDHDKAAAFANMTLKVPTNTEQSITVKKSLDELGMYL